MNIKDNIFCSLFYLLLNKLGQHNLQNLDKNFKIYEKNKDTSIKIFKLWYKIMKGNLKVINHNFFIIIYFGTTKAIIRIFV